MTLDATLLALLLTSLLGVAARLSARLPRAHAAA
jgi:hypothetical protein